MIHFSEQATLNRPKEICRHILSDRTTQAASNKRCLHSVRWGNVIIKNKEKVKWKFELQKNDTKVYIHTNYSCSAATHAR